MTRFDHGLESGPLAERWEDVFRNGPKEARVRCKRDIERHLKRIERATVYCEFFGPSSFAGQHDWDEPRELVVIDVSIHKRGIVLPADFVAHFGHIRSAEVVYEGPFEQRFVDDVRDGNMLTLKASLPKVSKLAGTGTPSTACGCRRSRQSGGWRN